MITESSGVSEEPATGVVVALVQTPRGPSRDGTAPRSLTPSLVVAYGPPSAPGSRGAKRGADNELSFIQISKERSSSASWDGVYALAREPS
ncbi:hypothetical protein IscW_ISCW011201 [Ixodes scapularis]|uniref:Uncharacterized protein n=1 Tax=Ixodes scapularis TaxID=6945 RepID=B7Q533_IXOSC|nr:hypothetical protein IscW_ISCW011201 [Ixodes scapularis]|eukprot:XP_002411672.1 hypothetical protein IscW_ISCW011201 [Ixodes scapularis]